MPNVTINIPDDFLQLYNQRRFTWNAYADANGLRRMPPATVATVERFIRDYMKGLIRNESYRLDDGNGATIDADELTMRAV